MLLQCTYDLWAPVFGETCDRLQKVSLQKHEINMQLIWGYCSAPVLSIKLTFIIWNMKWKLGRCRTNEFVSHPCFKSLLRCFAGKA